jgi:hypothetical protein
VKQKGCCCCCCCCCCCAPAVESCPFLWHEIWCEITPAIRSPWSDSFQEDSRTLSHATTHSRAQWIRNASCPSKYRILYLVKTTRSTAEILPHSFMIKPTNMAHPYANGSPSTVILLRGSTSYNLYSGYSIKISQATSTFYDINSRDFCVPRSDFFEVQFLWVWRSQVRASSYIPTIKPTRCTSFSNYLFL